MTDVDQAEVLLYDWQARLQEKADRTRSLAARVGRLTASAESAYGVVKVTVSNSGVPTAIAVDDDAAGSWAPSRVAAEIMATMRVAQRRLTDAVEELAAEEPEAGRVLLAGYHRALPDPEPADPEPAAHAPGAHGPGAHESGAHGMGAYESGAHESSGHGAGAYRAGRREWGGR